MPKRAQGIPAQKLDDKELDNELRQLYRTREETFFHGSPQAFIRHTERMLELEIEYAARKPGRIKPDPARTRAGSRRRAGQSPGPSTRSRKTRKRATARKK